MSLASSVVIIGGGFSGTLAAINLIHQAPSPSPFSTIYILDKAGAFAQGIAYGTRELDHLLNVQAIRMGAFSKDPEHFFRWMQEHHHEWKERFPQVALEPTGYVPRVLYALYLESLLKSAIEQGSGKGICLQCIRDEVVDLIKTAEEFTVFLAQGKPLKAKMVILATNAPTSQRFKVPVHERYIDSIWTLPKGHPLQGKGLSDWPKETQVAIIGTGLTMVDAAITLIKKGFQGHILTLSRHGSLPESHLGHPVPPIPLKPESLGTARQLLQYVRTHVFTAISHGADWRSVIDSLRPHTVGLWERLPLPEKQRFFRHLLSIWNKHRHRISPESAKTIQSHLQQGKLSVIKGTVTALETISQDKILVTTRQGTHVVDFVINCSGPQLNLQAHTSTLLKNILSKQLAVIHPTGIGLSVDKHFRTQPELHLYALGQLLVGQRLESVAVPELRDQCAAVASAIIPAK